MRDLARVDNALDRVLARAAPRTRMAQLTTVWARTLGPAIAEEAEPVSERRGQVRVSCRSSVWANELDLMAPELCERLNRELPEPWLQELHFSAMPVRGDPWERL